MILPKCSTPVLIYKSMHDCIWGQVCSELNYNQYFAPLPPPPTGQMTRIAASALISHLWYSRLVPTGGGCYQIQRVYSRTYNAPINVLPHYPPPPTGQMMRITASVLIGHPWICSVFITVTNLLHSCTFGWV